MTLKELNARFPKSSRVLDEVIVEIVARQIKYEVKELRGSEFQGSGTMKHGQIACNLLNTCAFLAARYVPEHKRTFQKTAPGLDERARLLCL
jgi:hypothetical protein